MRVLVGLVVAAGLAFGQGRGVISGEVVDGTGASVPNAKVTVTAGAIGLTRETVTSEMGRFSAPALPPAEYEVRVEANGFKKLARSGIRVETDGAVTLTLALEVGSLTERVDVTSDAPLVNTTSGELARTLSQKELQNFALPGRNPFYMLGIMPGVISRYGNFMTDFRGGSYSMGGLQINGQRKDMNFIAVDGINNGRTRDGVQQNNIMGVDFVEEVQVSSTRYAPEYGRSTGAQINFTTRRGTQRFHGSAQEFYFSEAFAAQQFIVGGRPRIRYHNYGFTIGGPVYIPGRWNNEKNKLFFLPDWRRAPTPASTRSYPTFLPRPNEAAISMPARSSPLTRIQSCSFPATGCRSRKSVASGAPCRKSIRTPTTPARGGTSTPPIASPPRAKTSFIAWTTTFAKTGN